MTAVMELIILVFMALLALLFFMSVFSLLCVDYAREVLYWIPRREHIRNYPGLGGSREDWDRWKARAAEYKREFDEVVVHDFDFRKLLSPVQFFRNVRYAYRAWRSE